MNKGIYLLISILNLICIWICLGLFVYGISEDYYIISFICLPFLFGFVYIFGTSIIYMSKQKGGGE